MIYATEQQVVVTAVLIVAVGLIAMFLGMWWGHGRGLEQAAEEQRWEREQARADKQAWRAEEIRRKQEQQIPPEVAHEAWLAHEEQALTVANGQAVTTGEIQAITDEMDAWLAVHVYSAPADYGQWLEREGR